jgi:hypothetical protein
VSRAGRQPPRLTAVGLLADISGHLRVSTGTERAAGPAFGGI